MSIGGAVRPFHGLNGVAVADRLAVHQLDWERLEQRRCRTSDQMLIRRQINPEGRNVLTKSSTVFRVGIRTSSTGSRHAGGVADARSELE